MLVIISGRTVSKVELMLVVSMHNKDLGCSNALALYWAVSASKNDCGALENADLLVATYLRSAMQDLVYQSDFLASLFVAGPWAVGLADNVGPQSSTQHLLERSSKTLALNSRGEAPETSKER